MRVLFLLKTKKLLLLLNAIRRILDNSKKKKKKGQVKYRLIKQVNFVKVLLKMFKRESNRDVFNIEEKKVYCC